MKSPEVHSISGSRRSFAPRQDEDGSGGWDWGPCDKFSMTSEHSTSAAGCHRCACHLAVPLSPGLVRRVWPGHCRDTDLPQQGGVTAA